MIKLYITKARKVSAPRRKRFSLQPIKDFFKYTSMLAITICTLWAIMLIARALLLPFILFLIVYTIILVIKKKK